MASAGSCALVLNIAQNVKFNSMRLFLGARKQMPCRFEAPESSMIQSYTAGKDINRSTEPWRAQVEQRMLFVCYVLHNMADVIQGRFSLFMPVKGTMRSVIQCGASLGFDVNSVVLFGGGGTFTISYGCQE